jgi:hypothetical protein
MDFAHVYVPSAVMLCVSLAFNFICRESYQEFPTGDVGVRLPNCGNGRRAFATVELDG